MQVLDDIQEQINALLANSPEDDAEEYAIHDYEGFAGYSVSEYEGIERAHEIACFIEEHCEIAGELLSYFGDSIDGRCAKSHLRQLLWLLCLTG